MTNTNGNDYDRFVDRIINDVVKGVSDSGMVIAAVNKVVYEFIRAGYEYGLSQEEVIDFFCVSSDSVIFQLADIDNVDSEVVLHVFDRSNEYLFGVYFGKSAQQVDSAQASTNGAGESGPSGSPR